MFLFAYTFMVDRRIGHWFYVIEIRQLQSLIHYQERNCMSISLKRAVTVAHIFGVCFVSIPTTTLAANVCVNLSGWLWLTPDATCKIATDQPNQPYLGTQAVPNTCFSVYLY